MTPERAPTRVALLGLGRVGRDVYTLASTRPDVRIVSCYSRNPDHASQDLGSLAGGDRAGVVVGGDLDEVLTTPADVAIVATTPFLVDASELILRCIGAGLDVLATTEELAAPHLVDPAMTARLDEAAQQHGVTLLQVGVNPGFVFDVLPLTLTGVAWDVQSFHGRRVVEVRHFSEAILRRAGLGLTAEVARDLVERGRLRGHIGLEYSMTILADSIGLPIDRFQSTLQPLIAERPTPTREFTVPAGQTVGFIQIVEGFHRDQPRFALEEVVHAEPSAIGMESGDDIDFEGEHPIHVKIRPGLHAQRGVAAMVVNSIVRVEAAPAGLIRSVDLPVARPRYR